MIEALQETLMDSLKLLPFLFVTYLVMELIEHKAGDKTTKVIKKAGNYGPILGGLLGIEGTDIHLILQILAIKIAIGILAGCLIDIILSKKIKKNSEEKIHEICEHEHCHCEEDGIIKSAIKHTIQIFIYIFIISLAINILLFLIGEEKIAGIISDIPIVGALIACLIGLIPNCASSVVLTEMYLENIIALGTMIGGLLVNSGLGLLILFKVNKDKKENFAILGILYLIGFISALIINLIF